MMRGLVLLGALLAVEGATPEPLAYFRFYRSVATAPAGPVCTTLDAAVYAHAAPSLKDLRLMARSGETLHEVPYVLTLSEAQAVATEPARVEHLSRRGDATDFDLAMPARAYTDVELELEGKDFVGTAQVSGEAGGGAAAVPIGRFTVFDLSSQRLARSTTLHLEEETFPMLHVELRTRSVASGRRAPVTAMGAMVPPSREAQSLFTVAAATTAIEEDGPATVARFRLPPHVPVERVRLVLDPGFRGNFNRSVRVHSTVVGGSEADSETVVGRVQQTRMQRDGVVLDDRTLTVPATLGANLQEAATVEVAIENGGEPPLPVRAVELEMRQRSLCFEAEADMALELFYGDAALSAPGYGYARTYREVATPVMAALGAEESNPAWRPRPDRRGVLARHPHLPYFAALALVCSMALLLFGSGKVQPPHRR